MALPIIISRLFSAYKEYKEDKKEKEKEKERLKKDESKETSELDSQEKNLKRKKSSQNKRRSRIKSRINQLKSESQKLEGIINLKKENIEALVEEKKSLQEELLNIDEKKQELVNPDKQEQESEDTQTQETDQDQNQDQNQDSDELKDLIDRKREIQRRLSEIESEISKLESELSSYENNLKEINDSLREEESDLEDIDNSIEDLDSDSENIKSEKKSIKDRFSELSANLQSNIEKVEKFLDKILLWSILTPIILKLIKRCWLWFKKSYGAKICNKLNTWAESADAPANILLKGLHRLACLIFGIQYKITQEEYNKSHDLWTKSKGGDVDYGHIDVSYDREEFTPWMSELGTEIESGKITSTNHHYYTEGEDLELTTEKLKSSSEYTSTKNSIKSSNPNISEFELEEKVFSDMYWKSLKLDKIYKDVSSILKGFLSKVDAKNSPAESLNDIKRAKEEIINNKKSIPFLGYFLRSSKSLNDAYDLGNLPAFKLCYKELFNRLMTEIFGENTEFLISWEYKLPTENACKVNIFHILDGRFAHDRWEHSDASVISRSIEGYQKAILFYLSFPVNDLSTDNEATEFTADDYNKYNVAAREAEESHEKDRRIREAKERGEVTTEVLDYDYKYLVNNSQVSDETKKKDLVQAYNQLVNSPTTRNVVLATAISKQANDERSESNIAKGGHEAVLNALKSANIIDKNVYYQSKNGDKNEQLIETLKDLEYELVEGGESNPQVGDIAFIPKGTNTPSQVAIYNGKSWVSDYYQGSLREMSDNPDAEVKVYRNTKYNTESKRRPTNLWNIEEEFEEQFFSVPENNPSQQRITPQDTEVLDQEYNYLIENSEVSDETKKKNLEQAYQQLVYSPTTRNVVLATAISKQADDERSESNITKGGNPAVLEALKSAKIISHDFQYSENSDTSTKNKELRDALLIKGYELVEGGESSPQVGDIAFIEEGTNTPSQVAIYNGKSWVSDYYQGSLREMSDPNAKVSIYRNSRYNTEVRRPTNLWNIEDSEEQILDISESNFNQQVTPQDVEVVTIPSATTPSIASDPIEVPEIDPKKVLISNYVNSKLSNSKAKKSALSGLEVGDPIHIEVRREPHRVDQRNKDNNRVYGKVLINGKEFAESYENRPLNPGNYRVHGSKKGGASLSDFAMNSSPDNKPWWYFMKTQINEVFPEEKDGNHIPIVNTEGLNRGGIRIHPSVGHRAKNSSLGCLTIGNRSSRTKRDGFDINDSKNTWAALMPYLHEASSATVTYKDPSTNSYNHNSGSLTNPPESIATSSQERVTTTDAGGVDPCCSSTDKSKKKYETDKGTNIETDSKSVKGSDSTDKKLDLIIGLVSSTLEQVSIARVESMPTPKTQGPEVTSSYIDNTSQQNTM